MKKLIKCYCGHTTTCDCGPEEAKQDEIMERFIANAKQQERSYNEIITELELRKSKQMNTYFKKFYDETIELLEIYKKEKGL
jgi:hypothetical protein